MWSTPDRTLRGVAENPAVQALHELLEDVLGKQGRGLPHSLRQAKPFLLGRDFGNTPRRHANDGPGEIYRFQLGPRAWSKPIYVYDGHKVDGNGPKYEQEAEELAKQLKLARWEKLACAIIEPSFAQGSGRDDEITTQITLCWQDDQPLCVVHDRSTREAIAFRWCDNGLVLLGQAHPERLIQNERQHTYGAYERPVISIAEGTYKPTTAERAGKMDELIAAISWRYATRLDGKLDGLLIEACDRLQKVQGDLGMAFAGHRFNDACGDDAWLAVRQENFAWENGAYFRSSAASLRSAPSEVHELLGVLVHLQAAGISSAFNHCYGYPVEALDVIGLFRQAGQYYFACVNSQGSSGPVYAIDRCQGLTSLCGFSDRFDWNFNKGNRVGGVLPDNNILDVVTLNEVVHRVEVGDTTKDGPPHDMDVPWMWYLPRDPNQ